MNNQAKLILQQCIRDYGTTLGRDPQRLEALLKDYAKGQHKREIFVYVQAARENVVEKLLDKNVPVELSSSALVQRLHDDYGLDLQLARWGVESWAFALNLSLGVSKQVSASKVVTEKNLQITKRLQDSSAAQPTQGNLPNLALIDGRYMDNGDGTVTDQQTGLQWMRCSLGQSWDGTTCQGKAKTYNWDEANNGGEFKGVKKTNFLGFKTGEKFSFAGYDNWRLPTIKELESIIENNNKSPSINHKAFPNTSPASFVWSSSPAANPSFNALGVHFANGIVGYNYRTSYGRVRLVRGGQ